jgi:hypothetical protein
MWRRCRRGAGRLAADRERIGIEALRHQHRAAREDEAVGRDEDGIRNIGEDLLVQLAVERAAMRSSPAP